MEHIILKIPRNKTKLTVVRSRDYIDNEINRLYNLDDNIEEEIIELEPEPIIEEEPEPEIKNTIFYDKFTFSCEQKPLELSLKNIPLNMYHIDIVKAQVQDSYNKGFEDGKEVTAAAYEDEINKYKQIALNFELLAANLRKEFSKELKAFENIIIPSAIMISQEIIKNEISEGSHVLINQIKKSIVEIDEEEILRIYVNPADVNVLKGFKNSIVTNQSKAEKIEIVGDSAIDQGSCIVETNAGKIDAQIKTQLEKIQINLEDEVEIQSIDDFLDNSLE